MKNKQLIFSLLLLFCLAGAQAQQANPASGGDATGSGGSAAYSVGQLVYTTDTGANGSVAQGVQQPFEISVITGITEANGIQFDLSAYPNPTRDYLTLRIENFISNDLYYRLYDISGQVVEGGEISGNTMRIPMEFLVPSTYFLKVFDAKKEIKTFKIIKN